MRIVPNHGVNNHYGILAIWVNSEIMPVIGDVGSTGGGQWRVGEC